jgi:Ca2+-transporting ATPase
MPALADDLAAAVLVRHARRSGRMRLAIPALIGDDHAARRLESSLRARPGVLGVHADVRSGRVLIEVAPGSPLLAELTPAARRPVRGRARSAAGGPSSPWHAMAIDDVAATLHADTHRGLDSDDVARRLALHGPNLVDDEPTPSRWALLVRQLANVPTSLLLGSAAVSVLLGDLVEAGAIGAVVAINAGIGYRVEHTSEQLLASWRALETGRASVIRGGASCDVAADGLVPGDLLVIRAGDLLHADARVCDAHRLAADEAALTGESEPVGKAVDPCDGAAPLAARASMLYRGTRIASGHGRAIVVATGARTEIAAVQELAAASRAPRAGLQRRLDHLTTRLAAMGLAASATSAIASLAWRHPPLAILRDTVALGVAAIPEGLPVTATAALVRAMARMRDRGMVVRRLATAETLGAVTVACVDKTGTLTENRMRLEVIALDDGPGYRRIAGSALRLPVGAAPAGPVGALLTACVLNSDLDYHHNGPVLELIGSATERALVEAARQVGVDPIAVRARWPRRRLVERSSGAHYVTSEHADGLAILKGAPEQVVPMCALDAAGVERALRENAALAADGLRVLAIASRAASSGGWRLLGLVALRDPLRTGAAEAIGEAARAGIRTVIVTGDQRATAAAIARQCGLTGEVVEGAEVAGLLAGPDAAARLARLAVVARVTPADKVAIVEALRRAGEVVAMAGDGINDAPALRAADVGIAVGARSSDLARQTADIVLEHEDLRSILAAVAEGRAVQDNLRRAIRFQAAGNTGEILLVVGAALAGRRLIPSLGLLWINLLTDTLPGLALALGPTDGHLLERPAARRDAPILDRADWRRVARDGAAIAAVSGLAAMVGGPLAAFGAVGASQFGYAAACRGPSAAPSRQFGLLVGGSAALHGLAVIAAPVRSALRLVGSPPIAALITAASVTTPLYLAWRRSATREIIRRGDAATYEEITS